MMLCTELVVKLLISNKVLVCRKTRVTDSNFTTSRTSSCVVRCESTISSWRRGRA